MVRLAAFPALEVIKGFKGAIDYACWKGIPYARSWPRPPWLPRSPAVQAEWPEFTAMTQSWSQLEPITRAATEAMVVGSQQRALDMWAGLWYGHNIDITGPAPLTVPLDVAIGETMLSRRLVNSPTDINQTINVNNVAYQSFPALQFLIDFAFTRYTHFRITGRLLTSQAAIAVTIQLALAAAPATPLSAAGNDLIIPTNVAVNADSGWIVMPSPPIAAVLLVLALKGANATVDLVHRGLDISFKYDP